MLFNETELCQVANTQHLRGPLRFLIDAHTGGKQVGKYSVLLLKLPLPQFTTWEYKSHWASLSAFYNPLAGGLPHCVEC